MGMLGYNLSRRIGRIFTLFSGLQDSFASFGPVLTDLIQWLYKLASVDSDLPDNSGNLNDALLVESNGISLSSGSITFPVDVEYSVGEADFKITVGCIKSSDTGMICGIWDDSAGNKSYALVLDASSKLSLLTSSDGTAETIALTDAAIDGTEHTAVVTKTGTSVVFELDGSVVASSGTAAAECFYTGDAFTIGKGSAGTLVLDGVYAGVSLELLNNSIDLIFAPEGQSNAEGYPPGYGTLPAPLQGDQDHYYAHDIANGTHTSDMGQLAPISSTVWGGEITMGDAITTAESKRVAVLKVTMGGTSLHTDWQKGGFMYTRLSNAYDGFVLELCKKGLRPSVRSFVFMQGEEDSKSLANANAWGSNFELFLSDIAADFGVASSQVVVGRIHDDLPAGTYPYASIVRAAQSTYNYIDTDAYALNVDSTHFSSEGLQDFGDDIAVKVLAMTSTTESVTPIVVPIADGLGDYVLNTANTDAGLIAGGTWTTQSTFHNNLINGFDTCFTSDGVDDRLQGTNFGNIGTNDFKMEVGVIANAAHTFSPMSKFAESAGFKEWRINVLNTGQVQLQTSADGSASSTAFTASGAFIFGKPQYIIFERISGVTTLTVNDVSKSLSGTVVSDIHTTGVKFLLCASFNNLFTPTFKQLFDGSTYYAKLTVGGSVIAEYDFNNLTAEDSSGNGNDLTPTNIDVDVAWSRKVPADIVRVVTTNPAGNWHNGAETKTKQDINAPDAAALLLIAFWSADGLSFDAKSLDQILAYVSGTDNLWFKFLKIGPDSVCALDETTQYPIAKVFTEGEYNQMIRWRGGVACGNGVIPFDINLFFDEEFNSHWLGVL